MSCFQPNLTKVDFSKILNSCKFHEIKMLDIEESLY